MSAADSISKVVIDLALKNSTHVGSRHVGSVGGSEVSVRQVSENFPTVPTLPTCVGSVGGVGSDTPTCVGKLADTCML